MKQINVSKFARHFAAYKQVHPDYKRPHEDAIEEYIKELPHGSGIDSGIKFDWDKSTLNSLMFTFGFHHMDENGSYDGWTDHQLIITPDLQSGYKIRISGKDRNMIKDYLYDLFFELFYYDVTEPTFKPQETTN